MLFFVIFVSFVVNKKTNVFHFAKKLLVTYLQHVGRNKTFRASARISISGISQVATGSAGNATTRYAWVVLAYYA